MALFSKRRFHCAGWVHSCRAIFHPEEQRCAARADPHRREALRLLHVPDAVRPEEQGCAARADPHGGEALRLFHVPKTVLRNRQGCPARADPHGAVTPALREQRQAWDFFFQFWTLDPLAFGTNNTFEPAIEQRAKQLPLIATALSVSCYKNPVFSQSREAKYHNSGLFSPRKGRVAPYGAVETKCTRAPHARLIHARPSNIASCPTVLIRVLPCGLGLWLDSCCHTPINRQRPLRQDPVLIFRRQSVV